MTEQLRNKQGLTEAEFLARYDAGRFPRPSVTVDTMIFRAPVKQGSVDGERELQVLLVKRGDHPCLGQWALPGGFVNMDESLDQAAARELFEETGLKDIAMEQLFTAGNPGRDPRTRIISTVYLALVRDGNMGLQAGDDAADARWFGVKQRVLEERKLPIDDGFVHEMVVRLELQGAEQELSAEVKISFIHRGPAVQVRREIIRSTGIAFDHAEILQLGLDSLKSTIGNSTAVFNLLPETFTLTELTKLCESLLGRSMTSNNIWESLGKYLTEALSHGQSEPHRVAKTYRYRDPQTKLN